MDYVSMEHTLEKLRGEHRKLDSEIKHYEGAVICNQLELQRMKRRKLGLKDEISKLEDQLYPDIIA